MVVIDECVYRLMASLERRFIMDVHVASGGYTTRGFHVLNATGHDCGWHSNSSYEAAAAPTPSTNVGFSLLCPPVTDLLRAQAYLRPLRPASGVIHVR